MGTHLLIPCNYRISGAPHPSRVSHPHTILHTVILAYRIFQCRTDMLQVSFAKQDRGLHACPEPVGLLRSPGTVTIDRQAQGGKFLPQRCKCGETGSVRCLTRRCHWRSSTEAARMGNCIMGSILDANGKHPRVWAGIKARLKYYRMLQASSETIVLCREGSR